MSSSPVFLDRREPPPEPVTPPRYYPSRDGCSPILTPDIERTPPTPRTPDLSALHIQSPPKVPVLRPSLLSVPVEEMGLEAPSSSGIVPLGNPFKVPSRQPWKRKRVSKVFIPLPGGKKLRITLEEAKALDFLPSSGRFTPGSIPKTEKD